MANGIDERFNKKRRPSVVQFDPVGPDVFDPKARVEAGTKVRIASSRGVRQPAKGYEYIENPETGEYLGVASTQSLVNEGISLSDEE